MSLRDDPISGDYSAAMWKGKKEKRQMRKLGLVWPVVLGLGLVCCLLFALPSRAQVNGALQTTDVSGTVVNGNIYAAKSDVYITGGPQNNQPNGLTPADGNYYFQ